MGTDQVLCKYYMHGACAYGTSCRFSHDLSKLPSLVCKYYLAGSCAWGDNCRYDHVRPAWAAAASGGRSDSSSGYIPPPQPKPATDALADQLPISRLRLGERPGGGSGAGAPVASSASTGAVAVSIQLPLPVPLGPARTGATAGALEEGAVGEEEDWGWDEEGGQDAGWEGEEGAAGEQWDAEGYREDGYCEGAEGYDDGGGYYYWNGEGEAEWEAAGQEQQQQQGSQPAAWQWPAVGRDKAGEGLERCGGGGSAVPPSQRSLCLQYLLHGTCSKGSACNLVHGDLCEHCHRYALHPADPAAAAQHAAECRMRHERLAARARSAGVECSICLEPVLAKAEPRDRNFGLMACEHPFCLGCIRSWRQKLDGPADVDSALRTCPVCRTTTHFITPSTTWPATPEEKDVIVNGYKAKLGTIDCKHFAFGEGTCPFGVSCFYRHAYRDGRVEEQSLRRAAVDEGEVRVLQPVRLCDFLSGSSAGQRLLAGRGRR